MKAIRAGVGGIVVDDAGLAPKLGAGDALVRPVRAAIAEPDLDIATGARVFSGVMGHQFVGIVEQVDARPGREDKQWLGKRVVGSANVACGKCDLCRAGLSSHCASRQVLGLLGRDGCFSERFTIPVTNLVEVPRQVSDDAAAFAEPLGRALHAAHILRVEGKPYVTVLGDGVGALLAAQVMARLNASVRLLGWQPDKFGLCERWGIKHRHADEVGRRHDQDIVVECTGTARGTSLALSLARPRAKVVLCSRGISLPTPGTTHTAGADLGPAIDAELELLGASSGSMAESVQTLATNRIETAPLITSRGRLSDGPTLLARAREPSQLRVMIDF